MCPERNSCDESTDHPDIDSLREKIDCLDYEILKVVNERARLAQSIGRVKENSNDSVYKPDREHVVYERALQNNPGPLPDEALKAVFREIISGCRSLEKPVEVAYLGPEGTFTHWAAESQFGKSVDYRAVASMADVFEEVENKRADYGVVPVENSTEGGIRETLALFLDSPLKVCAEIVYDIRHSLMAKCPIEEIKKVYSKGTVFAQARLWLRENLSEVRRVEVESTSRAARLAAEEESAAAIGFEALASDCGLDVLAKNIQDQNHNVTRFFVLGNRISEPSGNDKTALLCSIKDRVGAFHDLLDAFKQYGINMTKIESFPSQAQTWHYLFFIDFLGHPEDDKIQAALKEMSKNCDMLKVLGAFPCVTAGCKTDR